MPGWNGPEEGPMRIDELTTELTAERAAFGDVVAGVAPGSLTTPGLVGDWSAREVIAHLGYWSGRATEAIHEVELGLAAEEDEVEEAGVDAINETVARVARETDVATVRRREEASYEALLERLPTLDAALLGTVLPDGSTLEETIREDGALHYREHAEELRAALGGRRDA